MKKPLHDDFSSKRCEWPRQSPRPSIWRNALGIRVEEGLKLVGGFIRCFDHDNFVVKNLLKRKKRFTTFPSRNLGQEQCCFSRMRIFFLHFVICIFHPIWDGYNKKYENHLFQRASYKRRPLWKPCVNLGAASLQRSATLSDKAEDDGTS